TDGAHIPDWQERPSAQSEKKSSCCVQLSPSSLRRTQTPPVQAEESHQHAPSAQGSPGPGKATHLPSSQCWSNRGQLLDRSLRCSAGSHVSPAPAILRHTPMRPPPVIKKHTDW